MHYYMTVITMNEYYSASGYAYNSLQYRYIDHIDDLPAQWQDRGRREI